MKNYATQLLTGMMLSLLLTNANAETGIQTAVIKNNIPNSYELAHWSETTPCYINHAKDHPEAYSQIVEIFKETGFNIVDDDSVTCRITIFGDIKYNSSSGEKSIAAYKILDKGQEWPSEEINPNPQITKKINATRNQAGSNNDTPFAVGDGVNALAQLGSAIGGQSGALKAGGFGIAMDLLGSFNSRSPTPDEVFDVEGLFGMGGFFKSTKFSVRVFSASSESEKPEALFYAGMKRLAEALRQALYTEHLGGGVPFDMGCIHYAGGQPLHSQPAMVNPAPVPATCTPGVTPSSAQPAPSIVFAMPAQDTAQTTPK